MSIPHLLGAALLRQGLALSLLVGLFPIWMQAPADVHADDELRLAEQIRPLVTAHQGQVSVAIKHLDRGTSFFLQADEPRPTASLIKVAVMHAAYEAVAAGKLKLDDPITLKEQDKVPGSGILTNHFSAGAQFRVRDAIRLMMAYSDNTATNLIIDRIGLPATTEAMKKLGLPETRLQSYVFRTDSSLDPERSRLYGLGSTTAREMLRWFEALWRGQLISPDFSQQMLEQLRHSDDTTRLTLFLPDQTKVYMKTGSVSGTRTVAGIVQAPSGPFFICVLTSENKDHRFTPENAAHQLCAEIANVAYTVFDRPAPEAKNESTTDELVLGSQGELVEALQRTLNLKLKPSPKLSVDGDFGDATRTAVLRFQAQEKLKETGIVDRHTWQALGLLQTAREPVPDPIAVNSEKLPVEPPDTPDGPPLVSCKSWIVVEATTGGILGGQGHEDLRDFASTTKIMTAWIVLREAAKDPKRLDETLTFSSRADETPGSTAGIRAGEQLSVLEALYGLMLPSGNDAAVALAEHFGNRFAPPTESPGTNDPLARFVAEMNREAAALGMKQTQYVNPHGLTDPAHRSTAVDLIKLAREAWKDSRFREIVSTRQRGCRVTGKSGYARNVVWHNTNKLLEIEGYAGIKTGTTSAAGACLVSIGERNGRRLIVAVLGSTTSEARYLDTRNLFRWGWQQPPKP